MKKLLVLALALIPTAAHAGGIYQRVNVQLICHRTANRDMPENTLEAIAYAARMGCNVVELDIRRTLDGQLIINHDGFLERLTTGQGMVEDTSTDELALLDTGTWMGRRFPRMSFPRFEDALALARDLNLGLNLDIKTPGLGPLILEALRQEHMLQHVTFGGETADILPLYPNANRDAVMHVQPGVTAAQVADLHHQSKFVIAQFSANDYEMDLPAMRAAVAAGVDALDVDYPRLGADAAGRPIEDKVAALAAKASTGTVASRTAAIRELSRYYGFPTQSVFSRLLRDPDNQISRAAAVALVVAEPATPSQVFLDALHAPEKTARQNAAWALGITNAPAAAALLPLLNETDTQVLKETLLALSRCPGNVPADRILPFFSNPSLPVRGVAALALARHQPQVAATAVPDLLHREEQRAHDNYEKFVARGKPILTRAEIEPTLETYREEMKLIRALEDLPAAAAQHTLAQEAFRSVPLQDVSNPTALVAGYQMWDRIANDPAPAIQALASPDPTVSNRAEWMLVKAGPAVLPAIRLALASSSPKVREALIRVLAWQGDSDALPALRALKQSAPQEAALIDWATEKINTLSFK